ncbi:MAG TPA: hypothetical protein VGA09_10570 [Candidatus Binatia bacterium]
MTDKKVGLNESLEERGGLRVKKRKLAERAMGYFDGGENIETMP